MTATRIVRVSRIITGLKVEPQGLFKKNIVDSVRDTNVIEVEVIVHIVQLSVDRIVSRKKMSKWNEL